jgi:hypothetical protein
MNDSLLLIWTLIKDFFYYLIILYFIIFGLILIFQKYGEQIFKNKIFMLISFYLPILTSIIISYLNYRDASSFRLLENDEIYKYQEIISGGKFEFTAKSLELEHRKDFNGIHIYRSPNIIYVCWGSNNSSPYENYIGKSYFFYFYKIEIYESGDKVKISDEFGNNAMFYVKY